MTKRIISAGMLFFLLISLTLTTAPPSAAQDWHKLSADIDGDGLSNTVEEGGWYNSSGGPFYTDPLDADSDDDGLSDGHEKLFETDPTNDHSPGLHTEYQNNFQTREYFPWQQFGSKHVALATPATPGGYDTIVVRRGTTFSLGAPANAVINIVKSIPSLTTLNAAKNNCTGQWNIYVPNNGTVGMYTINATAPGWSESIKLYVIFQLPTGVSDAFIDAFIYNDDPNDIRDERAVHYSERQDNLREYTNDDGPEYTWIPDGEWVNHGLAWPFRTQHYQSFVFEDHVMPTINGSSNTWDAANALGQRVDENTCVQWPTYHNSSFCALNPYSCGGTYRNECTTVASLLTAFHRAAGIPSRPMWTDWQHSSFDHSTEVWTTQAGGSSDWYVMRGYLHGEGPCTTTDVAMGYVPLRNTSGWYSSGQGVYAVREDWPEDDVKLWWTAPHQDDFRMATWDLDKTAKTGQIVKQDWWETRFVDYWNWPQEPTVIGVPPADWPTPPINTTSVQVLSASQDAPAYFGNILDDYGVDSNNDGRFDKLVLEAEVYVKQTGTYWLWAVLKSEEVELVHPYDLQAGLNVIALPFDGQEIFMTKTDGPYTLERLHLTDSVNPGLTEFAENELAFAEPNYQTSSYKFDDFGIGGVRLSNNYTHYTIDTDSDNFSDTLVVETPLTIEKSGTYTLRGVLEYGQDRYAQATWTGTTSPATLQFENLRETTGPYTLAYLFVENKDGQVVDGITEPYVIDDVPELNAKPISLGSQAFVPTDGQIVPTFVITDGFTDSPVDTDGDGAFDQLVIDVNVVVEPGEGGQAYRLEGWLTDQNNNLIAWTSSNSQVLNEGLQVLSLPFDGRIINEHGADGPYTLTALKALPDNSYTVLDEIDIAHTTSPYDHTTFENPDQSKAQGLFRDDMENGGSAWSWAAPPWDLTQNVWHSFSHSWQADASSTTNGSLTSTTLDLSDYASPTLRFKTCYAAQTAGDTGNVELFDGTNWTTVATYTTSTNSWSTELVDLSNINTTQNMSFRFNTNAQTGLQWNIDDVYLSAWPGLTNVSFDYSPTPVIVGNTIQFTADYTSIDTSLPITYTWDFGDGSAPDSGASVTHQFPEGDFLVTLTVENPYDTETYAQLISSGYPVTTTSFTYEPPDPDTTTVISYTAAYQPITATNNITHPIIYEWNFGDGTTPITTTNQVITHNHAIAGNYTVTLTTTNDFGGANSNQIISIKEGVSDVSFDSTGTHIEDDPITFQTQITPTTATLPISYTWNFGDGSPADVTTDSAIAHTFDAPASYTVWVTANNNYGSPAVYSQAVTINGRPVTNTTFTYTQTQASQAREITFDAAYEPTNATQPITYTWNFDDGTAPLITATATISHQFATSGTFTVWLTTTNGWGTPVSTNQTITLPLDNDGDGLSNWEEWNDHGTDPNDPDSDDDGLTDGEEIGLDTNPNDPDSDGDGIPDNVEVGDPASPTDTDGDGIIDALDTDSDDDGVPDSVEAGDNDPATPPVDTDNDGQPDFRDPDDDGDGIPTTDEDIDGDGDPTNDDSDGDGVPNYLDPDDDGDGVYTKYEGYDPDNPQNTDADVDSIPDYLDPDDDGDDVETKDEQPDQNGDGNPDDAVDSNSDGLPDYLDRNTQPAPPNAVYLPLIVKQQQAN